VTRSGNQRGRGEHEFLLRRKATTERLGPSSQPLNADNRKDLIKGWQCPGGSIWSDRPPTFMSAGRYEPIVTQLAARQE
jgi:hypothetical protein